jgi:hypothetical protein
MKKTITAVFAWFVVFGALVAINVPALEFRHALVFMDTVLFPLVRPTALL